MKDRAEALQKILDVLVTLPARDRKATLEAAMTLIKDAPNESHQAGPNPGQTLGGMLSR